MKQLYDLDASYSLELVQEKVQPNNSLMRFVYSNNLFEQIVVIVDLKNN